MKWIKLSLETTSEAVDLVSSLLDELGISSIEIEDHAAITEKEKKEMFIDILPDIGPDDGKARVHFYLEEENSISDIIADVTAGLKELSFYLDIGSGKITVSETEDKDWINNWKQFFKPFRVDETIVIKPTWENLTETRADDLIIEIDPGTAFGTGSHETTKLCILGLKKYIKNNSRIVDVGCGSGILSIIGLKLGAESAVGIDIDTNAVTASHENAKVNQIAEEKFEIYTGDLIADSEFRNMIGSKPADIVVANILADVILPLSGVISDCLKEDGYFITSGLLNTREEEVKQELLHKGFKVEEINTMGEWVSIVARK